MKKIKKATASRHPDWAVKHKRPGTEIRLIKGHYYLYAITSKWNSEKRRPVKKTIGILGKITEAGFVESEKHQLKRKKLVIKQVWQREFGFTHFLQTYLNDTVVQLQQHFPDTWQTIVAMSFCRFVYQSPLKNMDFRFRHSYLSEMYSEVNLDKDHLTIFIRQLGEQREQIRNYFNSFWNNDKRSVLFDVSSITSQSRRMETFPHVGYNNNKNFDPQLNIMLIHSVEQRMPLYYRILPGNIREVKAFSLSLKEFGKKADVTVITDKGFYSNKNLEEMKTEGIRYIIPLRRNVSVIDYSKLQPGLSYEKLDGYFSFEKRIVWYYTLNTEWGSLYVYTDDFLKAEEQRDYLMRIEKYPDKYTLEQYHQKQSQFGTIALLTNGKTTAPETYENYKSRNEIEILFDAYKNILHADKTYMQNDIAIEAWMFINFIAIQWYYITFNLLKKYKLNKTYAPMDLMMRLTEIKKLKINDQWYLTEATHATVNLLDKLKITNLFPKKGS
ncbi:MAG: transposase [Chitinophagaceae bacterium]|nr:transposase [Chitinophagaceae bacterium]